MGFCWFGIIEESDQDFSALPDGTNVLCKDLHGHIMHAVLTHFVGASTMYFAASCASKVSGSYANPVGKKAKTT